MMTMVGGIVSHVATCFHLGIKVYTDHWYNIRCCHKTDCADAGLNEEGLNNLLMMSVNKAYFHSRKVNINMTYTHVYTHVYTLQLLTVDFMVSVIVLFFCMHMYIHTEHTANLKSCL